jgi:transposase InsO family protein
VRARQPRPPRPQGAILAGQAGPAPGPEPLATALPEASRWGRIAVSMGSRGDAYDNAVAESFFATLKKELVHRRSWPTRRELGSAVFEYIEAFYNRERRHSTLDMLSPAEYEQNQDNARYRSRPEGVDLVQRVRQTGGGP